MVCETENLGAKTAAQAVHPHLFRCPSGVCSPADHADRGGGTRPGRAAAAGGDAPDALAAEDAGDEERERRRERPPCPRRRRTQR